MAEGAALATVHTPRRLLLLRHGRTEWNTIGRAQGHADVPLDDVGERQVRAAAELLATLRPDRLWSSDLARAHQSATAVAERCGLEIAVDRRLREFDVGERQGLTWEESVRRFPWIRHGAGLGERLRDVPGAENDDDVLGRVAPAVEEALHALGPGELGVVVGHGAAHKIALVSLLGWPASHAGSLRVLPNAHWAVVESEDGTGERAGRRLVAYAVGAGADH